MKKLYKNKFGFTLIELLIVVAIISILSTLLMVNFIAVRQRGRDAQRKSDLRQIQSALELYRADQDSYPQSNNNYSIGNCNNSPTLTSIGSVDCSTIYMQKVPIDPNGASYYNGGNYYFSSDGVTYSLAACVENSTDKDSNISQTAPTGSSGTCSSGNYYVLQNP
jgi:general secretion pathway protein G